MIEKEKYGANDPLDFVVTYLEKANEDRLAEQVIDVFAKQADASNHLEMNNAIAKLYLDVRANDKAEKYALRTLELCTDEQQRYSVRSNLAKMYNNINFPQKSLDQLKHNAKLAPNDPDLLLETVFSLYLLNRKQEAKQILLDLRARRDELDSRHKTIVDFNLGTYLLEEGKFQEGMRGFMKLGAELKLWFSHRELPYKFWDGGIFPGKTLILFAEGGGIGDEMLSVRFMDDLKELGFDPVFYTSRQDLCNIFNRCGYKTVMNLDNIPKDAMWTYFMQVPIYLNLKPEEVVRSNYLYPSDAAKMKFLMHNKKLKIGIRWTGMNKNERSLHRNVPASKMIEEIKKIFYGYEYELYSLHVGDGEEEAASYKEINTDHIQLIKSYDDTFAFLQQMDYVISSCTSVVHAAAIVGCKTMAMIPISAYFTWVSPPTPGRPSNTSIWYNDNLRVFYQEKVRCWDKPFKDVYDYIRTDLEQNYTNFKLT